MRRPLLVLVVASGVIAVGAIVLACLPFATVRGYVDAFAGDGSADPYTRGLHQRLQVVFAACGAFSLGIAASLWRARGRIAPRLHAVLLRLRADAAWLCRRWRALAHGMAGWLVAITLLAAAARAMYLDQPMRFDESYTYLAYASQPWFVALSKYDAPNNHVFHSLCVLASTRVLGDAPWAIRLTAFLAGVLTVPATMLLARRVSGRDVAITAGLIAATSSALIEYSTNARGYTLICLCTVLAWLLAVDLVRRRNLAGWSLFVANVAIGCWTVPTMLYPLAMLVAWMIAQDVMGATRAAYGRRFALYLAAAVACAGLFTLFAYAPVLLVEGPRALFRNGYVQSLEWERLLAGVPGWLQELESLLLRDVPGAVQALLVAGLVSSVMTNSLAVRSCRLTAVGSLAACAVLCLLQRVLPFARVWLFLVPLAAVLCATGVAGVLAMVPRPLLRRVGTAAAAAALAGWPLWQTIQHESIARAYEVRALAEGEEMVVFLQDVLRPREPIVAVCPSTSPLVYYARRYGLDLHHFDWPATEYTRDDCAVIVVNRVDPQTVESVLGDLDLGHALSGSRLDLLKEYPSARLYRIEASAAGLKRRRAD